MKPTTQAKTVNQFTNQLEAMEEILASAMAGAAELGLNNYRDDRAFPSEEREIRLEDALLALRKSLRLARSIAISKNTKVYRARVSERNSKYSYLRTEYRARQTDCPIEEKKLLERAASQRAAVRNTPDLEARVKSRQDSERQAAEQLEADRKALQETLRRAAEFLAKKPSQQPAQQPNS